LFVTPLTSSLDPQRNLKIFARDFTTLLDPSGTRETRLVLVVSEVCARGYGAGAVRYLSTISKTRVVGRSLAGAAMEVAAVKQGSGAWQACSRSIKLSRFLEATSE
jgi:hypothetical protein